jgi:hypothetical protein
MLQNAANAVKIGVFNFPNGGRLHVLGKHIRSEIAASGHGFLSDREALFVEFKQGILNGLAGSRQTIGQDSGVRGCLGDSHPNVGPGDGRRIADQRHPANGHPGDDMIIDRREEGLLDEPQNFAESRWKKFCSVAS